MVSLCEGNIGSFNFLDFVYPVYYFYTIMSMHSLSHEGETRYSMKGGCPVGQGGAYDSRGGRWSGTPQAAPLWVVTSLKCQRAAAQRWSSGYEERAWLGSVIGNKVRAQVQRSHWAQRRGWSLRNQSEDHVSLVAKPHRIGL